MKENTTIANDVVDVDWLFANTIYTGVFINAEDLAAATAGMRKNPLSGDIKDPHVTVLFRPAPDQIHEELFGTEVQFTVTGYANNGTNEGVSVDVSSESSEMQNLLEGIEVPHITLAVSKEGKPVNTRFLKFESIAQSITVRGKYGAFVSGGKVIT